MNKRIRTDPHCFVSIVGPCGSGKTHLVSNMLLNQGKIFRPSFDKILYLYDHHQSNFDKLLVDCTRAKVHIEFRQGLDWTAVETCEAQKLRTLLVIDDLYQQAWEDHFFLDLVVAGRHRNIHLITLEHNLFQQSKHSKTIERHVTQMILFKSRRDLEQIAVPGRQMGDRQLLMEAYKKATREPFGHLHTVLLRSVQVLSHSFSIYRPLKQQKNLRMSCLDLYMFEFFNEIKPIVIKLYISHCSIDKMKFFCDCIFNMLRGIFRVLAPASKKKLNSQRRLIELLNNKKIGIARKRQGLSSSSGLKLLKLIQPSVSNHLKKRHGIAQ